MGAQQEYTTETREERTHYFFNYNVYPRPDEFGSPFTADYKWIYCPHFVQQTVISANHHNTDYASVDTQIPINNSAGSIMGDSLRLASQTDNVDEHPYSQATRYSSVKTKYYIISPISKANITSLIASNDTDVYNKYKMNQLRAAIMGTDTGGHSASITPTDGGVEHLGELHNIEAVSFIKHASDGYRIEYVVKASGGIHNVYSGTGANQRIAKDEGAQGVIFIAPDNMNGSQLRELQHSSAHHSGSTSPWGYYKISDIISTGYMKLDANFRMPPDSYISTTDITHKCRVFSCHQFFNAFGANPSIAPTDGDFSNDDHALEHRDGDGLCNGSTHGYSLATMGGRPDAVTMPYLSFNGSKLLTYQGLTGRSAGAKVRPVRFSCATVINGQAVIGNVDIDDKKQQRLREVNRIMWTPPFSLDTFTFGNSRDIGVNDGDKIIALESWQGRIFCLKMNNVYILNPANGFREEGRIQGIGVMSEHAYTETPYGVACANSKQITVLPSNENITRIIENTYQAETFKNSVLGYTGKHDELIFIPNTTATGTKIYRFSFITKSWSIETYSDKMQFSNILYTDDTGAMTVGMIDAGTCNITAHTDKDACELAGGVWSHSTSNLALYKFDEDLTYVTGDAILKTKEFIFDSPEIKKFISHIKMTYTATDAIVVKFHVDGNYSGEKQFGAASSKVNKTMRVNRQCHSIAFEFIQTSSSSASTFEIDDIIIEGWYNARNEQ